MKVQVKLFALLRELKGCSSLEIELPEGSTVQDALNFLFDGELRRRIPPRMLYALNQEYVALSSALKEGDEVVFVPPVSGG